MKYLLPLLFIFGCESLGVFKHEHEENGGACVRYFSNYILFTCYEDWTESYCYNQHHSYNTSPNKSYQWTDLTCEEFCDDVNSGDWNKDCEIQ